MRSGNEPELTLVVLAAGIGSRYGGLKQMDPVGPSGEFIIDYSIFDALRAGFSRVVFVIRRDIEEAFRATIGSRVERHATVSYARQELADLPPGFALPPERKKPWGTGQAVLAAARDVRGPFGVINADDFYGRSSYAVLSRFLRETADDGARYAMVGFILRNTVSDHGHVARGICQVSPAGLLSTVVERTRIEKRGAAARFLDDAGQWQPLTGDELVSMNMWGFKPSLFDVLRREFPAFLQERGADPKAEFFVPTVVNGMIGRGAATTAVLTTPESWCGVTYPEEKECVAKRIRELVASGVYPPRLWA